MISGIYLITNKINGHMYVGGSIDITRRFKSHKNCCDIKTSAIDKAINKYGKENFSYQIITELPADWNVIGEHEKYWIRFYNTFKDRKHYNLTGGGDGVGSGENHPFYGKTRLNFTGENNPNFKNYARIIKYGSEKNRQRYGIIFNTKLIKRSFYPNKLVEWFKENYPNEELITDEFV